MSKTVGDYVLKEKIGKGSYADVYKGTHKVTGERYAIKTISKDILSEPKLLAGLESEIKIMREFKHENIVCLHEYFSSEKNFYLVLELCEGGDLSKFIKKKKRLDERLAHSFLTQITSGLAFLHERNFIHRDLKPANVLLSEFSDNAVLKLADFGFARQLTVASLAQTRCGTPLYMAPEILESKDYDGKADIWSVGCIFYEMLVGTSPFKGANEGDLLMNIKTKELNVPKDVSLSKVSVEILIKLLERHPIRRASLAQLVALCTHLTNNPLPPAPSTSAPSEETGLALPVPNPNESRPVSQEQSTAERTPQKGPSPEGSEAQPSRRRLSSTQAATETDMVDPNFISPAKNNNNNYYHTREYAGGPAKGNLRGMFSPSSGNGAGAQEAYATGTPQDKYNSPFSTYHQQQQQSQQDAYASRRPSGTGGPAYQTPPQETQFSKTVRAPYANVNVNPTPKYPSPSSSPPTTGNMMSGLVSGFTGSYQPMQTSHSSTRSGPSGHSVNHVAPSTSPAAATIGMMGNLIAYVFNPSPTTNMMAESARTHSQQKQAQHARTTSLDRATAPNFGNLGNLGSGTPPPGSSSRQREVQQGRPTAVRENYFPAEPQSDSGYTYARNASSGLSVDDDFVLINKSSTDNDRRPTAEAKSTPSTNPSSNNSAYNSSNTGGSGEVIGAGAPQKTAVPVQQYSPQHDSEVRAHETAVLQALYATIVHKCEVYCAVVSTISSLGDQYVREAIAPQHRQQAQTAAHMASKMDASDGADEEDGDSIAGFLQPSNSDAKPYQQQAVADRYLIACSLYLHALSILSRLTKSFEIDMSMDKGEQMAAAMEKLKSDFRTVFDQLIARAESCQKQIDAIVNPDSGSTGAVASKYTMPSAEPIMIQAALKKEADASMEELLGNLPLACKLYQQASELVEGLTLTAHDLGDQRKLQQYSASLREKCNTCRKHATDLLMYN